ncbi:porin [Burkholderia sp. Ap-962]|uniref:porin n=1 Tax=Burkholderia sp. Ap-962 TaxID=2608333 RepID=UPI00141FE144|nr:porin [Burkholderia sp. Ap-962]NIF71171.1 porin [Burkholderia sp. Ap-962]
MKKYMYLSAGLLSVSGLAHSQSSVMLYGIIDEAVVVQSNQRGTTPNAASGSRRYYLDSLSGINGSRWGLRGEEALGGGLKAIFTLESGININSGALAQGGLLFGRQAFVGLASDRYGSLTLGRQYDEVVDFIGPLIFAGKMGSIFDALPGDMNNADSGQRINNAVKYSSRSYGGLRFAAMYSLGGVAGATGRDQVYSAGLEYRRGPLGLAAAYLKANQPNVSIFSNSAAGAGTLGTASTSVTTPVYSGYLSANSYQVASAGGTYAFGPLSLSAIYSNVQFQHLGSSLSAIGANHVPAGSAQGTAIFNAIELNAAWRITPAWQVGGSYAHTAGSHVTNAAGAAFGGARYDQFALATDYALSKRTDVYLAGVVQLAGGTDSTGERAVANLNTATASSNSRQAILRLGIRQKF